VLTPEQLAAYITPILGAVVVAYLDLQRRRALQIAADLQIVEARKALKLEEIHVDVNSKMIEQKKKTWDIALKAAIRSQLPEDFAIARECERDYHEQVEAQARADERVRLFLQSQRLKS
jgi:hypothetical protein